MKVLRGGDVNEVCVLFQYFDILLHKCFLFLFTFWWKFSCISYQENLCCSSISWNLQHNFFFFFYIFNCHVILTYSVFDESVKGGDVKKICVIFQYFDSCNINVSSFCLVILTKVLRYVMSRKYMLFFDILKFAT